MSYPAKYEPTGETALVAGRILHRLNSSGMWCFLRPKGSRPTRYYYFETKCASCAKDIIAQRTNAKNHFCPHSSCFSDFQRGENHPGWIGFSHSAGHKVMRVSRAGSSRSVYVSEHRLVMEAVLERELKSRELVHHIDCDKHNNDPLNLDVLSPAQHASAHQSVNGILRGLINARIVWYDRERKIYRSKFGEIDIQAEAVNRYQRNLRQTRREAGRPIHKTKSKSCSLAALIERQRSKAA